MSHFLRSLLRLSGVAVRWLFVGCISAWAALALYLDFNFPVFRAALAGAYLLLVLALLISFRRPWQRVLLALLCFLVVLVWWFSIPASNSGDWQANVDHTPYSVVRGTHITFYNVRSCDYRTEENYTCQWLTREVDLDRVMGVDLFMNYWGSPPLSKWIAHTILSFEIAPGPASAVPQHLAFSIEARKKTGQQYSSLRGFFRQYTLVSVISDERDLVRLRTNYRQGEDLYLYHTLATPEFARSLLMDYVAFTNQLQQHPQWYNAVTRNCTTEIFTFKAMKERPLDWRILINGYADEMLYDQHELATEVKGGSRAESFADLKRLAYINPAAKAADKDPLFSERIRAGRPGFP